MPKGNRLKTIERERGEPLEALIPRLIKEEGTVFGAAVALGVHPNTISYWLRKNNLTVETRQTAQVVEREDGEARRD